MADQNLILGEAALRKNRGLVSGYSAADAFGESLSKAGSSIQAAQKERKDLKAEISSRTAKWGAELDGSVDAKDVPELYRDNVADFLIGQRDDYWKHAKIASTAEAGSDAYRGAVAGMNAVNSAVKNLRAQLTSYNDGAAAYVGASKDDHISGGMEMGDLAANESVYSQRLPMQINAGGGIGFVSEAGGVLSLKDLPKLVMKDFDANKKLLEMSGKLYRAGNKLTGGLATVFNGEVHTMLEKGGRDLMLHIATDESIVPGGLGIIDPWSLSTPELLTKVKAGWISAMTSVAADGYNNKQPRDSSGKLISKLSGFVHMENVPGMQSYHAALRDHATGAVPNQFIGKEHLGQTIIGATFDSSNGEVRIEFDIPKDKRKDKKKESKTGFANLNPSRPREWANFVLKNLGSGYTKEKADGIRAWEEAKIAGVGGYGSTPPNSRISSY